MVFSVNDKLQEEIQQQKNQGKTIGLVPTMGALHQGHIDLIEDAKLSAGQAAEIVGLSKRAFIEMLGKYGVSCITTSVSDLHSDIANA